MNTPLWNDIQSFNLDYPISEYGFSTRLATENGWTQHFTQKAVLEYKKFMYLAGTANIMVSPSEIVDKVWHQHLLFTQSYTELCNLIGKNIQHIPSTHNREDAEKFAQAKDRTTQLYSETFGEQPADIWHFHDMLDSLQIHKASINISTGIIITVVAAILLIAPFYWMLFPVYKHFPNPDFLICYVVSFAAALFYLYLYNNRYLQRLVSKWPADAFVWNLKPSELVYLTTQKLFTSIHAYVNQMIERGNIIVTRDKRLEQDFTSWSASAEEFAIGQQLSSLGPVYYGTLTSKLVTLPIFRNTADVLKNFMGKVNNSKAFTRLFFINTSIIAFFLLLGITRMFTGFVRDKPIGFLGLVMVVAVFASIVFLHHLFMQPFTRIIPQQYKSTLLPEKPSDDADDWRYFLGGSAYFATAFIPLVDQVDNRDGGVSGTSGSSCGSGCGSSCGGGCGGCGGGD